LGDPSKRTTELRNHIYIGLNGKFLRFRRDGPLFEALSYM
jgi:hypothetical protein